MEIRLILGICTPLSPVIHGQTVNIITEMAIERKHLQFY